VKHLSEEDGLDLARDAMPAPKRRLAEEHLQSECPGCVGCSTFWKRVSEIARRERENQVPATVLQAAEGLFADWRRRFLLPTAARRARPFFDSLLQPLPVGVRAGDVPPRRLIHRWRSWVIDLRMQPEPRNRLSIAGQVLEAGRQEPKHDLIGGVVLMSRDVILRETETNRFGEFELNIEREPDLLLFLELHGKPAIGVALPDVDEPLVFKGRGAAITEDDPEEESNT
jgi:hypothetical protein